MNRSRRWAAVITGVVGALVLTAPPASAHPMPHSVVQLDVHSDSITAQLQLPTDDLGLALSEDLSGTPDEVLAAHTEQLRAYLADHLRVTTPDGQPWTVDIGAELTLTSAEQTSTGPYQEVGATAVMRPPVGADTRRFVFADDAVIHQVVTHTIFISIARDWSAGQVETSDAQVGVIRIDPRTMTVPTLPVDLGQGSSWSGFTAMVDLGVDHIRTGTDHLLFLLTLLLPAPLLVAGRRWAGAAPPRTAVRRIAAITLAFTLGHSATLAVSALGRFNLPEQPIEILIAVSIFVSAVHALRPIFPGRGVWIAAGFGLIHGMAFSFTLSELGLSTSQLVLSLLGFNLGIEAMQIVVIALVLPPLVVLSRTPWGAPVRIVAAGLASIAATGWILDRLGVANPVSGYADTVVDYQEWVVVLLWVLTAAAVVARASSRAGVAARRV